jgi:glycine cleavage system H protein
MPTINGCNLPDDLYYMIDKHTWVKELDNGNLRVGMTSVALKLAGGKFIAVTPKRKAIGNEIAQGKSIATVESSKFVGPVPAPVSGTLVQINDAVAGDPDLVNSDPYGKGWIGEIQPSDWENQRKSLASGADGLEKYRQAIEKEGIQCGG